MPSEGWMGGPSPGSVSVRQVKQFQTGPHLIAIEASRDQYVLMDTSLHRQSGYESLEDLQAALASKGQSWRPKTVKVAMAEARSAAGPSGTLLIALLVPILGVYGAVLQRHPPLHGHTKEELDKFFEEFAQFSDEVPEMPGETFSREMIYQDHD